MFAFAWDLHAEWVARRTLGEVVPIWPLHRVYAVPAALGALEAEGIRAHVRGLRFRQLTHFLAPYVPIEVLVARTDAERARALLATTGASWHPMPLQPARSSLLAAQAAPW